MYSTDERAMTLLAETTKDWAPWRPMLTYAMQLRQLDPYNIELRAAEHRLRLIARRLLDAMGLDAVGVDDTLGSTSDLQRAVLGLFGRETTPPQNP